jgi:hypothetical protein
MGAARWVTVRPGRWGVVAALVTLTAAAGGCGILGEGAKQASKAAEISLQTPGTLGELPKLPDFSGNDPNVAEQPPGLSSLIAGYGRNKVPILTLNAYAGAPAGISVVRKSYEASVGAGQETGSSRCTASTRALSVCYRSQDNLFVAVYGVDKTPQDTAKIVDEAWDSVRA